MAELVAGSVAVELEALTSGFVKGFNDGIDKLEQLDKSARKTDTSLNLFRGGIDKLTSSFQLAMVGMTGLTTLFGGAMLHASSQAQTMQVALETSFQGSKEAAQEAQEQITEFANKTPYDLQQVMQGFIKLQNMGLDPSEKALTAYGNTASAMGKNLNEMVEAVADAATGEFERLKEFGIRASKQGDQVKFTFKGVEETVKFNSESIEQYLISLGETNFAGGMEAQSKTIGGAWSTLVDTVNLKLVELSNNTGFTDFVNKLIIGTTNTINDIENLWQGLQNFFTGGVIEEDMIPMLAYDMAEALGGESARNNLLTWVKDAQNIFQASVDLGKTTFDWIKNNQESIVIALSAIAGAWAGLNTAIIYYKIQAMGGLIPALASMATALFGVGVAGWAAVAPFLPFIAIGAAIAGVIALIVLNWDSMYQWVSTNWEYIVQSLTFGWDWIMAKFAEFGAYISTTAGTYWAIFSGSIMAAWAWITATVSNGISFLSSLIGGGLTAILSVFTSIWNGFIAVINFVWENIKQAVSMAFLVVYGLFTGNFNLVIQAVTAFASNMGALWGGLWDSVVSVTSTVFVWLFGALGQFLTDSWNALVTGLAQMGSTIQVGFWNFVAWIGQAVTEMVNLTIRWWGDMLISAGQGVENLKKSLSDGWNNIVKGAGEAWDNLKKVTQDTLDWLGKINLEQIGKDIVNGLINGIKSMGDSLSGALKGIVDGAVNSAKHTLGINSPSRRFIEIGLQAMQGLELGVVNNADLPTTAIENVTSQMVNVSANMVPSSPSTDSTTARTAPTIQIQGDLVVREEADIDKIANQLFNLMVQV